MKVKNHILIFITCFFLISCSTNIEKGSPQTDTRDFDSLTVQSNTQDTFQNVDKAILSESKYYISKKEKEKDNLKHISYSIKKKIIDSLNRIAPIYDSTIYNGLAISYFTSLANNLNGKPFFVVNADSLVETIMEILSTRLENTTDIVFLIDKTGSMDDDIQKVQSSMTYIMDYLEKFKNIRLGIAAYGDKNWQYDFWYKSAELTTDVSKIHYFMDSFKTIGNPDIAESVNDAIVRTVKNMNWAEGSKRLMLVIGDAPSQEPPLSDYSMDSVIKICSEKNVIFNLYPIVLSVGPSGAIESFVKKDFVKIYPNPVSDILNVQFNGEAKYIYVINDPSGARIKEGYLFGKTTGINFSDLKNGIYLVQIYDAQLVKYFSSQIVVQR